MPPFSANPHRFDPYKNFKFRVVWDAKPVAGVSKISGLKRTTEVVQHRDGGQPNSTRLSPGTTTYQPITLERGLTHDTEFEDWATLVWDLQSSIGAEASLRQFRRDLLIQLCNEAGAVVLGWKVYRCWVSEYQAMPDLDSNANAIAIEKIVVQNEGWERDRDITEPTET
jgi:phage tail-like protein